MRGVVVGIAGGEGDLLDSRMAFNLRMRAVRA